MACKIIYSGVEPKIFIEEELLEELKAFFSIGEEKLTLYLSCRTVGSDYHVTTWYMPEQESTRYMNIIPQEYLAQLGGPPTGDDGKDIPGETLCGIIRGGTEIKSEIESSDIEFAKKVFSGVSDFFSINLGLNGQMSSIIFNGAVAFQGASVTILRKAFDKSRIEYLRKFRKDNICKVNYRTGNTQEKRYKKIECFLLTQNKRWEEVV